MPSKKNKTPRPMSERAIQKYLFKNNPENKSILKKQKINQANNALKSQAVKLNNKISKVTDKIFFNKFADKQYKDDYRY